VPCIRATVCGTPPAARESPVAASLPEASIIACSICCVVYVDPGDMPTLLPSTTSCGTAV
jgi:hypothetical protein